MIHSVRRKLAQEMTLVTAERTREESGLPVDLWKKSVSLAAGGSHLVCWQEAAILFVGRRRPSCLLAGGGHLECYIIHFSIPKAINPYYNSP